MATTTTSIFSKIAILLQDDYTRWSELELLGWLNDGQREIALHKPNACIKQAPVTLIAGARQTLPADGVMVNRVLRNSNGSTVTLVSQQLLDLQVPDWYTTQKSTNQVKHYCYSPYEPTVFYVYPASVGGNSVDVNYFALPANVSLGAMVSIDDIYVTALINYIAFRAYSKDMEYAEQASIAQSYYQLMIAQLKGLMLRLQAGPT